MASITADAQPAEFAASKIAEAEKEAPLLTARQLAASKNDPMKESENIDLLLSRHADRVKYLLDSCKDLTSTITRADGKPGDLGLLYDDIFALRYCLSFPEKKDPKAVSRFTQSSLCGGGGGGRVVEREGAGEADPPIPGTRPRPSTTCARESSGARRTRSFSKSRPSSRSARGTGTSCLRLRSSPPCELLRCTNVKGRGCCLYAEMGAAYTYVALAFCLCIFSSLYPSIPPSLHLYTSSSLPPRPPLPSQNRYQVAHAFNEGTKYGSFCVVIRAGLGNTSSMYDNTKPEDHRELHMMFREAAYRYCDAVGRKSE